MNPTDMDMRPTDREHFAARPVLVTETPLNKLLGQMLSPRIEAFILTEYLKRSGNLLPSVARAADLSEKAAAVMKQAIERAYDEKLSAEQVVPNVMTAIRDLLERELAEQFGPHA